MTSVEEVRKNAKYRGIILTCHNKRERVVVLKNGKIVAVDKALYHSFSSLDVPIKDFEDGIEEDEEGLYDCLDMPVENEI